MKVVQFTIPVAGEQTVIMQEDILPHFYTHLHRHMETQITWIVKGEGTLLTGDHMHRFQSGDIFIIGANQPHLFKSDPKYFNTNEKSSVHSITYFFNTNSLFGEIMKLPELKSINKFIVNTTLGMQLPKEYISVASDAIKILKDKKNANRLAGFIQLLHLFSSFKKWKMLSTVSATNHISESEGLRMNDIYQYTMLHYTETITLSEIAKVAYLTPQAFCRYFKKHTRKTYITFLNEIRITEACKKIIQGDFESFASIAYKTGFCNVVTFNRVFKKLVGRSPSGYTKEYFGQAGD
ncbi:MAG: AraC family transcriptional regulator [Chitinophagaceae bacterium]